MNMNRRDLITIAIPAIFVILGFWLTFGRNPIFEKKYARSSDSTIMPEANAITDNIGIQGVVEQSFVCSSDTLSSLAIVFSRNAYVDGAVMVIELSDGYQSLGSIVVDANTIESQHRTYVYPDHHISGLLNKRLILKIYSMNGIDSGLAIMYNDAIPSKFRFGSSYINGSICFAIEP